MNKFTLSFIIGSMTAGVITAAEPAKKAEEKPEYLAGYVPRSVMEKAPAPSNPIAESLRWDRWETSRKSQRLTQKRAQTAGDRWDAFEKEYTPREQYSTAFQDRLVGMKYQLDRTVFALDQFVQETEKLLEFEYSFHDAALVSGNDAPRQGNRRTRRYYASPWEDIMDNARFRTDVDIRVSDGFVGLRLDFPFGD